MSSYAGPYSESEAHNYNKMYPTMDKKLFKKEGKVIDTLPNAQFLVELDSGEKVRCYLSGKMNMNKIKVMLGDRVEVELPPTMHIKNTIGRIVFRKK